MDKRYLVWCQTIAFLLAIAAWARPACADTGASSETDLAGEARRIAAERVARFGSGYVARVDYKRRLVYVSALDPQHLERTAETLAGFADAFGRTLAEGPLPWNVTVILPSVQDYRPLAPGKDVAGFYRQAERTLISIDRGRTLLHEFTHALHHADAASAGQRHPIWIVEGLATLLESSAVSPEGFQPAADARLACLRQAIGQKRLAPLEQLLRLDHQAFMADAQLCYAQARYLMHYIHEQGKLPAWYRAYKASYDEDATGRSALEKVLGRRLAVIEEDWLAWLAGLKLPPGDAQSRRAALGLEFQDCPEGVKVVSLVPGGAAEVAGRIRQGDVVQAFNGQAVKTTADLMAAIRSAGAMRTVAVDLVRHGRKMTVHQPLETALSR